MENQGKKLAVLAGCNYKDTDLELYGCINDVMAMKEVLLKRFGFDPTHIDVLTDGPGSEVLPTGANIKKALNRMVEKAQNGDILFLCFSGHGTYDKNDVDFRDLVNRLPKGVTLTILSDSCHSGQLIAQEKEQIGPSTTMEKNKSGKSKFVPIETIVEYLSSQTGIHSSDVGTHLLALFGSEASLKFRLPHGQYIANHDLIKPYSPDDGILLSGCQKNEDSQELEPETDPVEKACGAFSNAVQIVLKKHKGPITYKELVKSARMVLHEQKLAQHPCLYCSDANASAIFLMQEPRI